MIRIGASGATNATSPGANPDQNEVHFSSTRISGFRERWAFSAYPGCSLRSEFGELRAEFGELRGEIARQMLTLGLTLGSLIVAVLGTILTLGFTGAFS